MKSRMSKARAREEERGRKRFMSWLFAFTVGVIVGATINSAEGSDFRKVYTGPNNQFVHVDPNKSQWPGLVIDYRYNTNGLVSESFLVEKIEAAIDNLAAYHHVEFFDDGSTTANIVPLAPPYLPAITGRLLIEVIEDAEMQSMFGDYSAFAVIFWDNYGITGGQIAFNVDALFTDECWEGIASHELGHVLNLQHSDSDHSIMYAQPYHSCGYQQIPRKDDIDGLVSAGYAVSANYEPMLTYYDQSEVCIYAPQLVIEGVSYSFEACIPAEGFGSVVVNN